MHFARVLAVSIVMTPSLGVCGFFGSSVEVRMGYGYKVSAAPGNFQYTSQSAYQINPELFIHLNSSGSAQLVLHSKLRFHSYRVPTGQTLSPSNEFLAELVIGPRILSKFLGVFPYGGLVGSSYVQGTSAVAASLLIAHRPTVGLRVHFTPLHGPAHDITLTGFGEYWVPYSTGSLSLGIGQVVGGELTLNLLPGGIPLAVTGFMEYRSLRVFSGTQIEYQYGLGIKIFLSEPDHSGRKNPRSYYKGQLLN